MKLSNEARELSGSFVVRCAALFGWMLLCTPRQACNEDSSLAHWHPPHVPKTRSFRKPLLPPEPHTQPPQSLLPLGRSAAWVKGTGVPWSRGMVIHMVRIFSHCKRQAGEKKAATRHVVGFVESALQGAVEIARRKMDLLFSPTYIVLESPLLDCSCGRLSVGHGLV